MPTAFVMINTELGLEEQVFNTLKEIVEVKEVCMVYGVYDIITKLVAPTMDELKTLILIKIRQIPNIRSTLTTIIVEIQ